MTQGTSTKCFTSQFLISIPADTQDIKDNTSNQQVTNWNRYTKCEWTRFQVWRVVNKPSVHHWIYRCLSVPNCRPSWKKLKSNAKTEGEKNTCSWLTKYRKRKESTKWWLRGRNRLSLNNSGWKLGEESRRNRLELRWRGRDRGRKKEDKKWKEGLRKKRKEGNCLKKPGDKRYCSSKGTRKKRSRLKVCKLNRLLLSWLLPKPFNRFQ